jgi:hypothetical protein
MPTTTGFVSWSAHFKHDLDSEEWIITFGSSTDPEFDEQAMANRCFDVMNGSWLGLLSDDVVLERVIGRFGQQPGQEDLVFESTSAPVRGVIAVDMAPQNVAVLIKKKTNLGGRANQGRWFFPGILTDGAVNAVGALTPVFRDLVQGQANAWMIGMQINDPNYPTLNPYLLHRPDPVTGATQLPTEISALQVDATVATQRRRLRR